MGTVDGIPATISWTAAGREAVVRWAGEGKPDGPGCETARIRGIDPTEIHFVVRDGLLNIALDPSTVRVARLPLSERARRRVQRMIMDADDRPRWEWFVINLITVASTIQFEWYISSLLVVVTLAFFGTYHWVRKTLNLRRAARGVVATLVVCGLIVLFKASVQPRLDSAFGIGGPPAVVSAPAPAPTLGSTVPTTAPPAESAGDPSRYPNTPDDVILAREAFNLMNDRRVEAGVEPLRRNSSFIEDFALDHSYDMAATKTMFHSKRLADMVPAGSGVTWTALGENVAYGFSTAESLVAAWFNSPGHRANMLDARFTDASIAVVTHEDTRYFTLDLAKLGPADS